MYGSDNIPNLVTYYKKDANRDEKNYIYNNVSIWLSPSELEGLHMPPAEAGLTECCVVGSEAEMSGTQDYLAHNVTGLVSKDDLDSFIKMVIYALENKEVRHNLGGNLRTKIVSLGSRKDNMYKLLELMKALRRQK
jgi:glycosyltransferase involved in cell wall biosynthesis